jgi:chromosome segregation ATPase
LNIQQVDRFVQQRRFKGPVLGPIGAYVKIVQGKEQFAPIAELAIGNGALDRFIVTNDHDRKLFQKIRKDAGCRQECGVFQMHQHPRYNIPPPPVEGIETVASVLNVTDDLVFNCLVDNCKIEERALSKSKEESEQLLLVRGNNGHSIRGKVKNVFCLPDGDNWSVKHGNLNMVANEKKLRQTIGVDKSAALAEARREINGMKEELAQHSREESRFEHEHHQHQKEWNVKKRESQNNNKEIEKLISLRDKIKEDQVSAENFDTDTSEYEQVVTEAQQGVDKVKENERSLTEEIEEKNPEIQDLKTRLEEVRIRNDKVLNDMRAAEDDLALYVQNLSQRQEKLERKRDKVKELENICEKQEARIKEIKGDVKNFLMKARVFTFHRQVRDEQEEADGEEVDSQLSQDPTDEELKAIPITDTDKEPTYYETRMKRAEKKIEQEKKRRNATKDDPAVAYQKYTRAKTILASRQENIEKIDKTSSILKEDVAKRKKRWRQFREHIAMMTDTRFDEVLNRKGSSGQIDFDHKTKELNLIVQKDSADANSQQRDVKALSGGERSYTTIALLLALGESLETPFRVLDEFDVFLDPVTRKLTIEALIKMAKAMQHRQFIFITPQDVSNVEVDPMLKVVKMKPPARNNIAGLPEQQTLDFSQSQS